MIQLLNALTLTRKEFLRHCRLLLRKTPGTRYLSMELHSFYFLSTILFLSLSSPQLLCHCQQVYLNNTVDDCSANPSAPKGYLCNGPQKSCTSFLVFRSKPPYNTTLSIAYLLGSEASTIASINKISNSDTMPLNKSIIVPTECSCSGNIYQHNTPYSVIKNDTYYQLVIGTYQGLTTCQLLMGQNYYPPAHIPVGAMLTVPLVCACPSAKQRENGVTSLLVYSVNHGDTLQSIGGAFGVDEQSIREANELPPNSTIFPFSPLLLPLKGKSCKEDPNSFFCISCSQGQGSLAVSDASLEGLYCNQSTSQKLSVKLVITLAVGIGVGFLCLFLSGYKLYQCLKEKRRKIRKEKLFRQNGGFLLQEKIISCHGSSEKAKLFSAGEIKRATDNYNQSRFLGQGGYGTVYKGMLPDGAIVAVKKSKEIDRNQIESFINEVVILSQINHRNIVKLLGCCLETEAPLLVYEFIPNGTLSRHIHSQDPESSLSWDSRLRIACEVAGAVAYMHFSASIPIFHRDIKPTNILLDENLSAKVSDFGTSKSVPDDRTHLTTAVRGTFGYIDPEYFQSSQFTDKSDVYSFGVVLVELITGKKPISFLEDEGQNLIAEFISLMKENQPFEIVDPRLVKEARKDDILAIANLATRCLRLNGKKRPTMKEIAVELEALRKAQSTLQINQDPESQIDRVSVKHTTRPTVQESTEESISLSLQMESTSLI